jgi:hypothetical protein
MQADYSVELGGDAPALELPWRSDDGSTRYYNLKQHPDLVLQIPEALASQELSTFLTRINAPGFLLETVKCDTWFSTEIAPEEEIFNAAAKYGSYVDLVFSADEPRLAFEQHEALAKNLCALLKRVPEMAASIELVIRRCYFHSDDNLDRSSDGFCITAYVSGFGEDEAEARKRWSIALALLQNALVQVARS